VLRTRVGYSGGTTPNPTYRSIGDHTEAISIDYDPKVIRYEDLLERFWRGHRCQSEAYSRQYMNAVFSRNDSQREAAQQSRIAHAKKLGLPEDAVVTPVITIDQFTLAEFYHQNYRIAPHDKIRQFLEASYPDLKAFADSTVATRLNSVLGSGDKKDWQRVLEELPQYGLPTELESKVREEGLRTQ
jgi:peptide-methionine (S)-S-oxide reductase